MLHSKLLAPLLILASLAFQDPGQATPLIGFTAEGRQVALHPDGTWEYLKTAPDQEPAGFRGVPWGSMRDVVIATEGGNPASEQDGTLFYRDTLAGRDVLVAYELTEGLLTGGRYLLQESHKNKTDYLNQDYETWKSALTAKYGKPSDSKFVWKDDLYRDDPAHWGMAISVGHLVATETWRGDETEVVLGILGDNFEVNVLIDYRSTKLAAMVEAAARRKERVKF